jgi:hypothetical protein
LKFPEVTTNIFLRRISRQGELPLISPQNGSIREQPEHADGGAVGEFSEESQIPRQQPVLND